MAASGEWPRVGVYSFDYDLYELLIELDESVSNRELLYQFIMKEFRSISDAVVNGHGNPYILRERHRRWTEFVGNEFGNWLSLPSWEDIQDPHWEEVEEKAEEYTAFVYENEPEWIAYGDGARYLYNIIDDLPPSVFNDEDAETLVETLLTKYPGIQELYLWGRDVQVFYAIRTTCVEGRYSSENLNGVLHFGYVADADREGPYPTFVIPPDLYNEWKRIQLDEERRQEQQCQRCGGNGECERGEEESWNR